MESKKDPQAQVWYLISYMTFRMSSRTSKPHGPAGPRPDRQDSKFPVNFGCSPTPGNCRTLIRWFHANRTHLPDSHSHNSLAAHALNRSHFTLACSRRQLVAHQQVDRCLGCRPGLAIPKLSISPPLLFSPHTLSPAHSSS